MIGKAKQQKAWSKKDARYDKLKAEYDEALQQMLAMEKRLREMAEVSQLLEHENQGLVILHNKILIEIRDMAKHSPWDIHLYVKGLIES